MERTSRARGRLLGSSQAVLGFAILIYVVAAIDVATRALDPFAKAKLAAWMLSTIVALVRIIRVLRKHEEAGAEWRDAELLLLQLGALMPIAAIIPLAFV